MDSQGRGRNVPIPATTRHDAKTTMEGLHRRPYSVPIQAEVSRHGLPFVLKVGGPADCSQYCHYVKGDSIFCAKHPIKKHTYFIAAEQPAHLHSGTLDHGVRC